MKKTDETALQVAKLLLEIKAVKLSPSNHLNGQAVGIADLLRQSHYPVIPQIRTYIRQQLSETIRQQLGVVDIIAGVATAGIPQAALVRRRDGFAFNLRAFERQRTWHGQSNRRGHSPCCYGCCY